VVQTTRLTDGSRKVTGIAEVGDIEHDQVIMNDIFTFERAGVNQRGKVMGKFVASGYQPQCLARLRAYGVHLSKAIFHEQYEVKDR
jgi:hypothetical protein